MASAATLSLLLLVLAVGEYNCDPLDDLQLRCSPTAIERFRSYFYTMSISVDEFCERYEEMQPCLELIYVDDPMKVYIFGTMDYICADSRRDQVRQAATSSCMATPQAARVTAIQLMNVPQECMQPTAVRFGMMRIGAIAGGSADGATTDLCPIIDIFSDCITDQLNGMCGEEFAEVARGLLERLFQIAVSPQLSSCFDQVAQLSQMHSVAKRAVEAMNGQV